MKKTIGDWFLECVSWAADIQFKFFNQSFCLLILEIPPPPLNNFVCYLFFSKIRNENALNFKNANISV
jgi:hypothetical protein